ncbi:MAG: FMN-binding negative transcriptional regulator [Bacteroidetes bacterium]|nr:FMN-binding negative transcriptional regulator [Bacteroidota bacterium]
MYHIPHFKAAGEKDVLAFMHANPFITLCGCDENNFPVATHVPVLFKERDNKIFLQAHTMRKQKHTLAFEKEPKVLAIFTAAHSYVSASWYSVKNVASTWNYQAVHANGILSFKDDVFLYKLLSELTEKFEANPHSPSLVEALDKKYVSDNMKAIVGFEIELTQIEHVFKLSQNRDEKSYDNIIQQLGKSDDDARNVAERMKENRHNVFKSH